MKHNSTSFAYLLSILLCTAVSVSCGSTDIAQTGSSDSSDTNENPVSEAETAFTDGLPERDFGGSSFRIAITAANSFEFDAKEQTGDLENDAIYERNRRIEERFHIGIEPVIYESSAGDSYDLLAQSVLAGDNICEIAGFEAWNFYRGAMKGIYQNWRDTAYIQFDKPWWNQRINDGATFHDKLFGLSGSLAISYMQNVSMLYSNSVLLADHDILQSSLYQTVRDGNWTLDTFSSINTELYSDLNGNNKSDDDDFYGYAIGRSGTDAWQTGFDIPITGKAEDGTLEIKLLSEKTASAVERMNSLLYSNSGVRFYKDLNSRALVSRFAAGQFAFFQGFLWHSFYSLRDMQDSYGILPMPKFDENQKEYHSLIVDEYSVWTLPITVSDADGVSLITDALCADTYYNTYPQFYDNAMKSKYSEDAETAEMVDLIVGNADFDISFMYGVYLDSLPYLFRECLKSNKTELASSYTKIEKGIQKKLEEIYKIYE